MRLPAASSKRQDAASTRTVASSGIGSKFNALRFLGRPRGWKVDSSPRFSAVVACQTALPKGRPRCTDVCTTSNSAFAWGRFACNSHPPRGSRHFLTVVGVHRVERFQERGPAAVGLGRGGARLVGSVAGVSQLQPPRPGRQGHDRLPQRRLAAGLAVQLRGVLRRCRATPTRSGRSPG